MAALFPTSAPWPASPAAGHLPSDPYYKLRRQAELAERAPATAAKLGRVIDKAGAWDALERNRKVLDMTAKPLAMFDAATITGAIDAGGMKSRPLPSGAVSPLASRYEETIPAHLEGRAPREDEAPDRVVIEQQQNSETWLARVAPDSRVELTLAAKRLEEAADCAGEEQAAVLAQGLGSVRRAVRKLADALWPARKGPVTDRFGEERRSDDGGYVSRIGLALQSAADSSGKYRLEKAELEMFHKRLTALVDRISAGVHGEGDYEESRRLHVDAWRLVGACRQYAGDRPAASES